MASIKANTTSLKPGHRLGDYQLLLEVGVGGMGRVWAARRMSGLPANHLVAVKTGLGEVGGSPEFERLFMDEARIASQIHHPNACGVHQLSRDRGLLYLVMEWCDGATLRDVLDGTIDQRLEYELAARIVGDVAAGLHAAHELVDEEGALLNVVHRDVSPQNVLMWSAGHVKLADFGVAKARGQLHRPTETGEVKGKLSYMAPEQVTSSNIDRRADVFGLGCLLYEATVGKRPYQGGDALATLYQLLERETVRPSDIIPDYPRGLEAIVMNALERNPADRYATAADMGRAMAAWLASRRAVVSEAQVAAVVHSAVGERLTSQRGRLADTIERLDSHEILTTSFPPAPDVETNEPSVKPVPRESSVATTLRNERPRRRRRDREVIAWLAGGASALLVVVVVLALGLDRATAGSAEVAGAHSGVGASSRAEAVPVEVVLFTVRATPAHAMVRLDDGKELANPLVRRVPADGSRHMVVVTAPGYAPKSRRVTFDAEHDLVVELEPLDKEPTPPPSAADAPVPLRVVPRSPRARYPGTRLPAARSPEPRSVRPLDEANPFGEAN